MRFRILLFLLIVLLVADCVLTSIAVGHLGATEMNPLYYIVGGLSTFIAIKVVISVVAIVGIVFMERTEPKTATSTVAFCCGVYGVGFILNAGELIVHAGGIL